MENAYVIRPSPFRITPYLNDHSAFDAYSLLIEAGGKRLVAAVERGDQPAATTPPGSAGPKNPGGSRDY